jgi:isocitrate/isopropylmalate dehydrogenase
MAHRIAVIPGDGIGKEVVRVTSERRLPARCESGTAGQFARNTAGRHGMGYFDPR